MRIVVQSRIVGTFLGYAPGLVHQLDDGSAWEQVGMTEESVYRERPGCRVVFERDRHWIDVDGTSAVAEVRQYQGRRWSGPGAY